MSDASSGPRRAYRYEDPEEAYKIARRRITNNARRRKQRSLDLSNFGLAALPSEIGELTDLQFLHIRGNRLTGLPAEISGLENLFGLYASSNELTGLPPEIGGLKRLRFIDFENNQLLGLPREFSNLVNLRQIEAQSNRISEFPSALFSLSHLENVDLSNNEIAAVPTGISQLGSLLELDLTDNSLIGLPTEIGRLANLRQLSLSGNKIVNIPKEIGNLSNLERLLLDNNKIAKIPDEIGNLRSLVELSLRHNVLDTIPSALKNLVSLNILHLMNNNIDHLPETIGSLRSLGVLNLRANQLERLPSAIADLSMLSALFVDQNKIVELPEGLDRLKNLTTLDLRSNRLVALPSAIGDIPVLSTLRVDKNRLTEIPPELGKLSRLQVLSIEDNELVDLPKSLGAIRSLDRAAMNPPRSGVSRGLFLKGNPLVDPYPLLIAHGQPSATTNVLAWLRGELDSSVLQGNRPEANHPDIADELSPPPAPELEQGPNLHLVSGKFDLATNDEVSGDFDRSVQAALHARLVKQLDLLKEEAQRFSNQHPLLARTIVEYADLAVVPLDSIDVVNLWTVGNALIAQAVSFQQQDSSRTFSEPLEPHQLAILLETTRLHGGFILGFAKGAELTLRADRLLSTPQTLAGINSPTSHVLSALGRQRHFLSDRARKFVQILEGALLVAGWRATRAGYSSYATVRNFLIDIGKLLVIADERGSTLSGGIIVATALSVSGMNMETFAALVEFFRLNASQILSFAAPFPELRAWVEWIINHLDAEKELQ